MIVLFVVFVVLGLLNDGVRSVEFIALLGLLGAMTWRVEGLKRRLERLEANVFPPSLSEPSLPTAPRDRPVTAPLPKLTELPVPPKTARAKPPLAPKWDWLEILQKVGGDNPFGRLGGIILLIAMGFLLAYLNEQISHLVRVLFATTVAVALLVGGQKTRRDIGLILQGTGFGIGYLTAIAAYQHFDLIDLFVAMGLVLGISLGAVGLAIKRDAQPIAALGLVGGFLTPLFFVPLAQTPVILFSLFLFLNLLIVGLSVWRPWRALGQLGALMTFGVGAYWGSAFYTPDLFNILLIFLGIFHGLFVGLTLITAYRYPHLAPDVLLLVLVALAALFFANELLPSTHLAIYTGICAVIYGGLAIYSRYQPFGSRLSMPFTVLGVGALVVTLPLLLTDRVTVALWSLIGALLVELGCRERSVGQRTWGYLILIVGSGGFLLHEIQAVPLYMSSSTPLGFLEQAGLSVTVIVGSLFWVSYRLDHSDLATDERKDISDLLSLYGLMWWSVGSWNVLATETDTVMRTVSWLGLMTLTNLVALGLWRRWPRTKMAISLLFIAFFTLMVESDDATFDLGVLPVWIALFGSHYALLHRHPQLPVGGLIHGFSLLLLLVVGGLGFGLRQLFALDPNVTWQQFIFAWIALGGLGIVAGLSYGFRVPHERLYRFTFPLILLAISVLWTITHFTFAATSVGQLPHLPVLNPYDLTSLATVVALGVWMGRQWTMLQPDWRPVAGVLLLLFKLLVLQVTLLRGMALWRELPYEGMALIASEEVQAATTGLWGFVALSWLWMGQRQQIRLLWGLGAMLMLLTVAKLLLFDLEQVGTLARIGAFFVAALVLLAAGTLAPRPPAPTQPR